MLCRDQYDPDAPLVKKQVLETFAHQTDAVRVVAIEDAQGNVERLTTTDDHPFWVDRIGWVAAADLATGTVVTTADGRTAIVVENYSQLLDSPAWVYNLEVADGHTYFVEDGQGGQSAIWVHNKCALAKAVNLPAWKKVGIDMEHILSGHKAGGVRSAMKSLFPSNWSDSQIERAVRQAYRTCKKVATQGDHVLLRGTSAGVEIEMWLDRVKKIIKTAYPI